MQTNQLILCVAIALVAVLLYVNHRKSEQYQLARAMMTGDRQAQLRSPEAQGRFTAAVLNAAPGQQAQVLAAQRGYMGGR